VTIETPWSAAMATVRRLPARLRDDPITAEQARLVLRCPPAEVDDLVEAGWTTGTDDEGRPLFDSHEIMNLGLHSGRGRSLPELGSHPVRRLADSHVSALSEPRHWNVSVFTSHSACPACTMRECDVQIAEVDRSCVPDWRGWDLSRRPDSRPGASPARHYQAHGRGTVEGAVELLRNDAARAAVGTILNSFTYQFLPARAQRDTRLLEDLRVVDCVGAAHLLAAWLRPEGIRVDIRYGLLMFPVGSGVHAWLELLDDDGRTKRLDPTLAMLSTGRPHERHVELLCGSTLNVVLPLADNPLAARAVDHACACCRSAVTMRVVTTS